MLPLLERLAILQERDRRLIALETEAREVPARRQAAENRLREAETRLEQARERQKATAAAIHQAELDAEAAREKTGRLRRQQYEIKSNEQYRTLLHEIDAELARIRAIEDREIELMEEAEAAQAGIAALQGELDGLAAGVREELRRLAAREEEIREETGRIRSERKALEENADPAWLDRYNRLLAHVGARAIVPVERDTCGGCHMRLPPHLVQETKREKAVCTCTHCGRMLYWQAG